MTELFLDHEPPYVLLRALDPAKYDAVCQLLAKPDPPELQGRGKLREPLPWICRVVFVNGQTAGDEFTVGDQNVATKARECCKRGYPVKPEMERSKNGPYYVKRLTKSEFTVL